MHGIQVSSYPSEAKISDARTAGVVDENVWLARCQYGGEAGDRIPTYTLEVPVNHLTGVEVIETLSDTG